MLVLTFVVASVMVASVHSRGKVLRTLTQL